MEHFPLIHTNFWDAVIAVPLVMVLTIDEEAMPY